MTHDNESVPPPPSPERPPLAPYDPPDPAPQAAAWRRAVQVVMRQSGIQRVHLAAARQGSSRYLRPLRTPTATVSRRSSQLG